MFFSIFGCKTTESTLQDIYNKSKLLAVIEGEKDDIGLSSKLYAYYDSSKSKYSFLILKREEGEYLIKTDEFIGELMFALGIGTPDQKINHVEFHRESILNQKKSKKPIQEIIDYSEEELTVFKPALDILEPIENILNLSISDSSVNIRSKNNILEKFQAIAIIYPFIQKKYSELNILDDDNKHMVIAGSGLANSSLEMKFTLRGLHRDLVNLKVKQNFSDVISKDCTNLLAESYKENCIKTLESLEKSVLNLKELAKDSSAVIEK